MARQNKWMGSNWMRWLGVVAVCAVLAACAHQHGADTEQEGKRYWSKDRDNWQQPERVIAKLELKPGMVVADLGSGTGYFTHRLAGAVGGTGKVYAVDINQELLDEVEQLVKNKNLSNVELVLAEEYDPQLPEKVDMIFSTNVYHHLKDRADYFENAKRYLKPGGRVVILDFREGAFRHNTPRQTIVDEFTRAGYTLANEYVFLDRQNFLVFTPQSP